MFKIENQQTTDKEMTLNDITKMDRDINFIRYKEIAKMLEDAIAQKDADKISLYTTMLRFKEKDLIKIFEYRIEENVKHILESGDTNGAE